ncbi:hypothetical protein EON83_03800 [bacterium]|nr:MAG: hypothetical protein EON83_03800 [bacterium]
MKKNQLTLLPLSPTSPQNQQYSFAKALHFEEVPLSAALRQAVDSEAQLRSSRGFDEQFWNRLEERRARNSTLKGRCQQLFEWDMSGMAVWRVLGSGALGAVFPALVVACCTMSTPSQSANLPLAPVLWTVTAWNQRRFWEELAWKNPTRPVLVSLLDPNWKGGRPCAFRFAV